MIQNDSSFVDVGLGVRYVNLDTHITFSQSPLLPNGPTHSESVNSTDAIFAVRGSHDLSSKWRYTGMPTWERAAANGRGNSREEHSTSGLDRSGWTSDTESWLKTTTQPAFCMTSGLRARIWVFESSFEAVLVGPGQSPLLGDAETERYWGLGRNLFATAREIS